MRQTIGVRNAMVSPVRVRHGRWGAGIRNVLVVSGLLVLTGHAFSAHAQTTNPVVIENANPGTDAWQITHSADDTAQQIKGYASATSVNRGQAINFLISTDRAQSYRIEIYRMGWYGGAGGRLMSRVGPLAGLPQAPPAYDAATGMVSYRWNPSYRLQVPATWTSGFYLAKLINADGFENYIGFVVRDDSRSADLLYQQPVTTYQAYNAYPRPDVGTPDAVDPGNLLAFSGSAFATTLLGVVTGPSEIGDAQPPVPSLSFTVVQPVTTAALSVNVAADIGKSLYDYNSSAAVTKAGTTRALKVSFDRPYEGWGDGQFFAWEFFQVQWLERNGYDVAYATNIDVHRQGANLLQRHRGFLSVGHDEYWSARMLDSVEAARDGGVDLAFFGSNAAYWQVRLERNAAGAADRTLVCYKSPTLDPETRPAFETTRWREVGRPEQALLGVQYITDNEWAFNTDFVITNSDNWVYADTGFKDGDTVTGIVGYEVDQFDANVPAPVGTERTLLSASPFTGRDGTQVVSNASVYRAPSDAWVFATGTMSWSWALGRDGFVDERIGTTTRNVLRRFLVDEPPGADVVLVDDNFDTDSGEFSYGDDRFRGTANPAHANGWRTATRGFAGGALSVRLGGGADEPSVSMSGGWEVSFELPSARPTSVDFRYALSQTPDFESDEYSELLLSVDGALVGTTPTEYIARVSGDGDGGNYISTGWQRVELDLGTLAAGSHRLAIGGFGNQRSDISENTEILIDEVVLTAH